MTDTPNDGLIGCVTKKPEHCFTCFRLILPGYTYSLPVDSRQSSNGLEYLAWAPRADKRQSFSGSQVPPRRLQRISSRSGVLVRDSLSSMPH